MNEKERYFPYHHLEHDIGLAEYNLAATRLDTEERSYNWATNTATMLASGVIYIAFKLGSSETDFNVSNGKIAALQSAFLILVILFSYMAVVRFSHLVKLRVFAARKVIVLRRMLGVSYGENTLVLPNWRIEGADNPFSIKMYPGLLSHQAFPVQMFLIASVTSILLLYDSFIYTATRYFSYAEYLSGKQWFVAAAIYAIGCALFRYHLFDNNENWKLTRARLLAKVLRVTLVGNIEQAVYGVRITVAEANRLETGFNFPRKYAVFIEDKQFYSHNGINYRGIARAAWQFLTTGKKSGGSSITQQYVRSNYIYRAKATVGRKLVEMLLAKWAESVFTKSEILDAYLSTARFDRDIYGIHVAYKHFFLDKPTTIDESEAFFMIERLANIRGYFLGNRVKALLKEMHSEGMLTDEMLRQTLVKYQSFMGHHFKQKDQQATPEEIGKSILTP